VVDGLALVGWWRCGRDRYGVLGEVSRGIHAVNYQPTRTRGTKHPISSGFWASRPTLVSRVCR
jgi:hypothetical protein